MKQFRCLLLYSLVIAMMAGCSKQDVQQLADDPHDATDQKNTVFVPFKGQFKVYVDHVIHMPPPPPKEQLSAGNGNVTHLGKTNVSIVENWWPPKFPETPATGTGEITFTAANGDILLASYINGKAYHYSTTYVEVTFTGHFKDGGTGRFEHASGYFSWEGVYDPTANEGSSRVDGEISFGSIAY